MLYDLTVAQDRSAVKELLAACMCADDARIMAEIGKYESDASRSLLGYYTKLGIK